MANELDQVYFKNHIHRNLRASDDALGEASAHGLSLASNVQIGTTGAALKIFKLDSTGNLTTSNNFVLAGVSGATGNLVTVRGQLTVESGNGLVVNSQSGITVTSSNTGNVFLRLQRPSNAKDGFVYFTPSGGVLSASNPEFRVGMASGTTGLYINIYDGTTSTNMLTMTSAGLVNITSGVTISGNLSVSGTSTLRGNVTTTGTLQIGGDTTVTGIFNVTGASTFSGASTFKSGVTISGNLSVSGTSTLRGNTDILGNLTLTGTLSTPSYTLSNGSAGGNTWASFNKRIYSSALAVSSDPFDQTNGAPWYGLGLSTGSFPNTANAYVQLAGFFGVLIKAGGGSSVALQSDGKVGINTTAPASGLDVASDTVFRSGVTVSGILQFNEYTNFVPTNSVYLGYWANTAAGTVGTWYKIASFTAPSGTYRGSSFVGSVMLANTNWGDAVPTEHFFEGNIQYYNGSAVLVDSGTLKTSANFPSGLLQLVKTGTAAWELQLGLYSQNKQISWKIEPIAGYVPTYFDRAAAGTAVATGTTTDSFESRIGTTYGSSLDLTSTLKVDGISTLNNQLFVYTTNSQMMGVTRSGTASTGGLSIYHYLRDDATAYLQDSTMFYMGAAPTGGFIYSTANSSATHRFHVGGFSSTASEKMQINAQGVRITFAGNQSGAGAAVSDELQVGGATFISGLTTIFTQGESLKLAGTNASYFGLYPTGATSASTNGREGYIGFANGSNRDLYIFNASTTGSVRLVGSATTGSAVKAFFSGATQSWSVENDGVFLVGDSFNTGGSVWRPSGAQVIIGGGAGTKFNLGTAGGGTGVKLLIHGHDNDGSDIYPLYIEDENSNADFWVRGRKLAAPTRNTTVYVGGDLGIGTSAPGAALDVNSSAIVRGGLTVSGSLGVSGTASSVFGTAITAGAVATSNLWYELGTITLTAQYQQESVRLELTNDGGSGSEDQSLTASVMFRVKQQNAMTGTAFVDVLVPYAMGRIAADDIIAVATQDDASAKVIKLHARLRTNYDNFKFTILNNDLANFSYTRNATGVAALPTGTQYTGIAGIYANSYGSIGFNTSSPASGLDVNFPSTFRTGVTISGTLGVSGLATFSSGVTISGTLGVSGLATFSSGVTISGSVNSLTTPLLNITGTILTDNAAGITLSFVPSGTGGPIRSTLVKIIKDRSPTKGGGYFDNTTGVFVSLRPSDSYGVPAGPGAGEAISDLFVAFLRNLYLLLLQVQLLITMDLFLV